MNQNKIRLVLSKDNKDKLLINNGFYDNTKLNEIHMKRIKSSNLTLLANHYKSDKGTVYGCSHNYTKIYEDNFKIIKDKSDNKDQIKLLEIGVACGSSLKMWASYFENSKIIGVDINQECKNLCKDFNNIEIKIGDILNLDLDENYDIIIDDGSHLADDILQTFYKLFPFLNKGGIYVIEDLKACSNIDYVKSHFKFKDRKYSENIEKFVEMNSRPKIDEFYECLNKHKFKFKKYINNNSEICFIYN